VDPPVLLRRRRRYLRPPPPHDASGYLFTFFLYFALQGAQTIGQSLPFGLTLGASRRSFYFGTALLGMVSGLV
jgi:hypothetical protein